MKVKLAVSGERYEEVKAALAQRGIDVDEDADLVLTERDRFSERLMVKDAATGERILLPVEEIVSIEAFGHTVKVYAGKSTYQALGRLYQVQARLDPERFLRISNSVMVAKDQVRRITPTLSMKFILTLTDGRKVDVTRSYYYIFKEAFGI